MSLTRLEYSLDGGAYRVLDTDARTVNLTGLADGQHTLTIMAEDSSNTLLVGETKLTIGTADSTSSIGDLSSDYFLLLGVGIVAVAVIGGANYIIRQKK